MLEVEELSDALLWVARLDNAEGLGGDLEGRGSESIR